MLVQMFGIAEMKTGKGKSLRMMSKKLISKKLPQVVD